jgi:predicted phage tail protein
METNLRPTFLTVLCVLTFIFSGYSIFNGITSYTSAETAVGFTKDAMEEAKDKIEEDAKDEKSSKFVGKVMDAVTNGMSVENVKNNAIATVIGSILTLLGAILMWGLNKKGFWLYVAGTAVTVIAPAFIFGGLIGLATAGVGGFFGVLFCVLYGINLKFMK